MELYLIVIISLKIKKKQFLIKHLNLRKLNYYLLYGLDNTLRSAINLKSIYVKFPQYIIFNLYKDFNLNNN